jgi:pimeloyl-ACP methyl ester carboxylesterase
MNEPAHQTGTVHSGDVNLFYRLFGAPGGTPMVPGGTPIVVVHGANYYDSADWIEVAAALADGRQVLCYDQRGFGQSDWSLTKDYSLDAAMADITALVDHMGWSRIIILGHSMGERNAILFAARHAERAERAIIVDHCPGRGGPIVQDKQSVDNLQEVFPSIEAAQETMSRDTNAPPGSAARDRLESFLRPVEGGFAFPRDPDFNNMVPVGIAGWAPAIRVDDMWDELAAISCPTLIVRGTRSNRYRQQDIDRVHGELPHIRWAEVDADHDVAAGAPGELIAAVKTFLAETDDAAETA